MDACYGNVNRHLRLDGKLAIVTASTDGIGFAIARRLAQDGAHVVLSSRKKTNVDQALSALKNEGLTKVSGLVCHVGKAEDRAALITHAVDINDGHIDILVANAGINPYFGRTLDMDEQVWDKIFDVNLKSTFLITREVVPHMERRGGSVVYVSSFLGFSPLSELGAYSVSKTALLGLTKVLAKECAGSNVRVNCIAPGLIKTKLSKAMWSDDGIKEAVLSNVMMRRFGEPGEIGGLVSFLCSDDASYVTGEVYGIGGGISSRL